MTTVLRGFYCYRFLLLLTTYNYFPLLLVLHFQTAFEPNASSCCRSHSLGKIFALHHGSFIFFSSQKCNNKEPYSSLFVSTKVKKKQKQTKTKSEKSKSRFKRYILPLPLTNKHSPDFFSIQTNADYIKI